MQLKSYSRRWKGKRVSELVTIEPSNLYEASWGVLVKHEHYQQLLAIEAAAREVVYEFSMPSELDGAEQAALDKLRLALSGGEGK